MNAKKVVSTCLTALLAFATPVGADATECGKLASVKYNSKVVRTTADSVSFVSSQLAVDADGAPNSYRVDGNGLSYTCDGVTAVGSTPDSDPKHWQQKCRDGWKLALQTGDYTKLRIFGFLTGAKNVPVKQDAGDPLPNEAYITTTSVSVADGPAGTQRHWIDANEIPYIVLSPKFVNDFKVRPGDLAVVYRPKTGKFALAVYGDGGKLGEASVRLHQDLGNDPMVDKGGVKRAKRGLDDSTLAVVFPGVTTAPTVNAQKWRDEIKSKGDAALKKWGGIEQLKACAK